MNVFTVMSNVSFVSGFEPKAQRVVLGTFTSEDKAQKVIDEKVKSIVEAVVGKEDGDWGMDLDQLYEEYYEMFMIVETKIDDESKFQDISYTKFNGSFIVY